MCVIVCMHAVQLKRKLLPVKKRICHVIQCNPIVSSGKFNYGVPSTVKKRTWAEITARINEIGECEREVGEVIKKWSDMKCDTKRKVAAVRSGLKGCPPSRFLREFTPTENIIRKILELDGQQGGPRTSSSRNGTRTSAAMGPVEDEDGGGEEDDDMEMDMGGMGSMHSSPDVGDGDRGARTGALDPFSRVPPPFSAFQSVPSTSAMTTPPPPPSAGLKEESAEGDSLFDSSGELSSFTEAISLISSAEIRPTGLSFPLSLIAHEALSLSSLPVCDEALEVISGKGSRHL